MYVAPLKTAAKRGRRLFHAITMTVVCALSLFLVLYVGFGEGQRIYKQFLIEKLVTQGRVAQSAMETFLRAGLPLRQYVGFANLAEPMVASSLAVVALAALDLQGRVVFTAGESIQLLKPESLPDMSMPFEVRENDTHYQAVLPLRNKFETVGHIAITMPSSVVANRLESKFEPLIGVALGFSVAFGLFVFIAAQRLGQKRSRWLHIGYAAIFLTMAVTVIGTLLALYAEGAQAKTRALAISLGQRVHDIAAFNLNLQDFEGLDRTFADYRNLNPEISAAALTVDGRVVIHTNPDLVGTIWRMDSRAYEYLFDVTKPGDLRDIKVAVALPGQVVNDRVGRSVKNFAALFLASAFLAGLFLQLADTLHQGRFTSSDPTDAIETETKLIKFIKPVFFVGVFVEHLSYAFLPQFIQEATRTAGLSSDYISIPFTLYYLCFALTLVPAGRISDKHGARRLIFGGLLLVTLSLLALAYPLDYWMLIAARATAGIGQAMLFIGVQTYILTNVSPNKRTQGADIIVFGFQGGMISGAAIGSLLVVYIGAQAVFMLAAIVAVAITVCAIALVPVAPLHGRVAEGVGEASARLLRSDLAQVVRSFEFMRTMILVGVPAKAIMTGIIFFALPLLMAARNYAQEDIGQIIMLYAVSVLAASFYVSRRVDRTGGTFPSLVFGTLISGIGLVIIGMMGHSGLAARPDGAALATLFLVAGTVLVGLAHGFINAPIITHIAETELAAKIGPTAATATYRFLERIGHVAGPIVVGQLFLFLGPSPSVTLWAGGAVIVFGTIFMMRTPLRRLAVQEVKP